MQTLWWVLIWFFLFASISTTPQPPDTGQEVTLDFGEQVVLVDGSLSLTFERVVDDSRCPTEVNCFWSGMVVVAVEAEANGHPAQTLLLGGSTDSSGGAMRAVPAQQAQPTASIAGYEVQLLAVTPYPAQVSSQSSAADYRIILRLLP